MGETKCLYTKYLYQANKLLRKAKAFDPVEICYKPLDLSSLQLEVYSDTSFSNLTDQSSQCGMISFIVDGNGARNIVEFYSKRIRRICRSTFASELLACNSALDYIMSYKSFFKSIGLDFSKITLFTDSKGLRII